MTTDEILKSLADEIDEIAYNKLTTDELDCLSDREQYILVQASCLLKQAESLIQQLRAERK